MKKLIYILAILFCPVSFASEKGMPQSEYSYFDYEIALSPAELLVGTATLSKERFDKLTESQKMYVLWATKKGIFKPWEFVRDIEEDPDAEYVVYYSSRLAAFPTAVGANATGITGGRNGKLCFVTTTSTGTSGSYDSATDTYSGSFKYLQELDIPSKFIIFKVAGMWQWPSITSIYYGNGSFSTGNGGNMTILGSTAPSPGVFFFNSSYSHTDPDVTNVVLRGLTVMAGNNAPLGQYDGVYFGFQNHNVIVANMTSAWAADENISMQGFNNNQQYNLFLEGIPGHNKGGILGPNRDNYGEHTPHNIAGHNCVGIHIDNRLFNGGTGEDSQSDQWNNCGYNFNGRILSRRGNGNQNYMNNYFKTNRDNTIYIRWNACNTQPGATGGNCYHIPGVKIPNRNFYWKGNKIIDNDGTTVHYYNPTGFDTSGDIARQHITFNGFVADDPLPETFFTYTQWPWIDSRTEDIITTPDEAYQRNVVGKAAGSIWVTDSQGQYQKHIEPFVDDYYEDFINGTTSAFRASQSSFTVPSIGTPQTAYTDTDKDGIADAWEDAHGLDKNNRADGMAVDDFVIDGKNWDNPGYPNREVFFYERDIVEDLNSGIVPPIVIIKKRSKGQKLKTARLKSM